MIGEHGPYCERCYDSLQTTAPEMYEALVEGEAYMRKDIPVDAEILYAHPAIVKMQKAIQKARGEE